jgi:hypothetical protein
MPNEPVIHTLLGATNLYSGNLDVYAFEENDDCLCVPRQVAVLLHKTLQEICESFDELLEEGWQEIGVRPEEVERWAALHGHPYILLRGGYVVKTVNPPQKLGKCIAYCIHNKHAYFYKTARSVSQQSAHDRPFQSAMIEKESRSSQPDISEWQDFDGIFKPGYYFCEDIYETRELLLKTARLHKISLMNGAQIITLKYMCTKSKDRETGLCTIKEKNCR